MGERGRGWWMEERCPRKVDGGFEWGCGLPDSLGTGGGGGGVETQSGGTS